MSKSYTPTPGSVAGRLLEAVNRSGKTEARDYKMLVDVANHIIPANGGPIKHIPDSQAGQALFTLAKHKLIKKIAKKTKGKRKTYLYASLNQITNITPPVKNLVAETPKVYKKFIDQALNKDLDLQEMIRQHMLDIPINILMGVFNLTSDDIQELIK